MTVDELNAIRAEELKRRVGALPAEVSAWIKRSGKTEPMKIHMTQVLALEVLMSGLIGSQMKSVNDLPGRGDEFTARALGVIREVIRAQRIWDFFRSQLSLRFSDDFQKPLWIVDTIAWNCHRPVLEAAQAAGILSLDRVREPPLTYVVADVSPVTYVRGSAPQEGDRLLLGSAVLPIPVIHVPPDQLSNAWELLTVAHEVGHDLEKDLDIVGALVKPVESALIAAGRDQRLPHWQRWLPEVFADLVALQLVGPAFGRALRGALTLPDNIVTTFNPTDEHPTPYVRVLMVARHAPTIVAADAKNPAAVAEATKRISADAARIEGDWTALYPVAPPEAGDFLADAPIVCAKIMDTPLPQLKNQTVRSLIPFKAAHDLQIRAAADYLATGANAPAPNRFSQTVRHCVAAAQYAVDMPHGSDLGTQLAAIDTRTRELIVDNTPDVVRGSASKAHDAYISDLAAAILKENLA
jgi:hypothetical protein